MILASDTNEQVTSTIGNSITTNKMESFTTNPGDATTEASQSISASEISLTTQQDTMAKTEMTSQGTSTEEVESESNVMLTASTTLYPETIETTTIITTTTTKTDHNEMEDNENAIPNEEKPIDGEVMDKNKNQSETTLSTQIDYKTTSEMPEIQTQTQVKHN